MTDNQKITSATDELCAVTRRKRQKKFTAWGIECCGLDSMTSRRERAMRLLEEALELAQAMGVESADADRLVWRAYGRPVGDPEREVAQVATTLLAVAEVLDVNLDTLEVAEMAKIDAGVAMTGRA